MEKETSRNQLILDGWILEKLICHDDIAAFDCGDHDLTEYFRHDSLKYRSELMTQTYCFYPCGYSQKDAVALVDFCNDSLSRNLIPNCDKRKINHRKRGYKTFPALKITRLGVDVIHRRTGIGSRLLDAVKLFFLTDNRSGCRFLTVDAYRTAQKFYEHNGFVRACLPEEDDKPDSPTIPMFFDLRRIDPESFSVSLCP